MLISLTCLEQLGNLALLWRSLSVAVSEMLLQATCWTVAASQVEGFSDWAQSSQRARR